MARRFKSLGEIQSLPGYVEHVDTIVQEQAPKFLGDYEFEKFIHCALRGHHRHGVGFVVEFEDNGVLRVVAVGHVCGKKLFGIEGWDSAWRAFDEQVARRQLLESLAQELSELPAKLDAIESLLTGRGGAQWLDVAVSSLSTACCERTMNALYARATHREDEITQAKERDDDDMRLGFNRKSDFSTDVVARFVGLNALVRPSPRVILVERLRDLLRPFLTATAESLVDDAPTRREFQRLIKSYTGQLQTANRRLADATLFFTTENVRLIAYLSTNSSERRRLAGMRWNSRTGRVEAP
jgi:hypothetical protein